MEFGIADKQNPAREGTVEAWGLSEKNPVGGWYGLKMDFVDGLECISRHRWKHLGLQK